MTKISFFSRIPRIVDLKKECIKVRSFVATVKQIYINYINILGNYEINENVRVWFGNLSSASVLAKCEDNYEALAANWKVKGPAFVESDVVKTASETATTDNSIPAAIQLEIRVLAE